MQLVWHNSGHGSGSHGRNHRSPAAGSAGHHPPAAGADCRIGSSDRGVGTARERQDAAKLLAAAQHATSPCPPAAAETQVEEETRGPAGPPETRAAADPDRSVRRRAAAEAHRLPTLWRKAFGQRPGAAAAPGLGTARDQTARHRVPAASADLSLLWGMAYYRQSKRRTADFLSTLLGQPCSAALTVKIQTQVTAAARPADGEVGAQLPAQNHVNADETPTKEQNGKAWLWTFVARLFTVFTIRATRAAIAVDELLT